MLDLGRAAKSVHNRLGVAGDRLRGGWLRLAHGPAWSCGAGLSAGSGVNIEIYGTLRVGRDVTLAPGCSLTVGPQGTLEIGDDVFVGRHSVIVAGRSITIGEGTKIAEHCTVRDGDHHLDAESRRDETAMITTPVVLGAGCWIGAGARILRGAALGRGVVVGANAVVRGAFPDDVLVAGVPARVMRQLRGARS